MKDVAVKIITPNIFKKVNIALKKMISAWSNLYKESNKLNKEIELLHKEK